jgi:hypothetical protein
VAINQERMMKAVAEADEKRKKMIPRSTSSGSSTGALPSNAWCIAHLGVHCVDHNRSGIGAVAHNSNCGNSSNSCNSSSNNSSTVLLLHHHSRLPPGRHSSFPPAISHASTVGRWGTLLENTTCPSKATHRELWHPWSTSRGANKRVLRHRLAAPTTPPWRRFPHEKC